MEKTEKRETANARRDRLARDLMDAYNDGADYQKVITEIESYGDTFKGWLELNATGIVTEESFLLNYNTANVKVFRSLPPKLDGGWQGKLIMVEVIHDGVNIPPKYNGKPTFRKDIWR